MIQTIRSLAMALVGATLVPAAIAADDNPAAILVRFGNAETITAQDLSDYLDRRVDLRPSRRNIWGVKTILREMALSRALGLEGDSMGEPRLADREKDRFDSIYGHAVYKKLVKPCEPLADAAEARKYFDEHPQAFRVPPMVRLSRVMLPTNEKVEGEQAMDWLMIQAEAIALGKKEMNDVAKQAEAIHKLDAQGDLGWVTLTEDEPILRALASAKQGELVGPVAEGEFAYLFYLVNKREARPLAWDEVAASVPTRAMNLCRKEADDQLRDKMFKKYGVQLDQSAINGLFTAPAAK